MKIDGMTAIVTGTESGLGEDLHGYAEPVRHICENDMLNGEVIRLDAAVRVP